MIAFEGLWRADYDQPVVAKTITFERLDYV